MREKIAVNAEMLSTERALVATTHCANPLAILGSFLPLVSRWHVREGLAAGETMGAAPRMFPGYFDPVDEREEVVVGAREMGGEDEC